MFNKFSNNFVIEFVISPLAVHENSIGIESYALLCSLVYSNFCYSLKRTTNFKSRNHMIEKKGKLHHKRIKDPLYFQITERSSRNRLLQNSTNGQHRRIFDKINLVLSGNTRQAYFMKSLWMIFSYISNEQKILFLRRRKSNRSNRKSFKKSRSLTLNNFNKI